jgi:hypothetical protein
MSRRLPIIGSLGGPGGSFPDFLLERITRRVMPEIIKIQVAKNPDMMKETGL